MICWATCLQRIFQQPLKSPCLACLALFLAQLPLVPTLSLMAHLRLLKQLLSQSQLLPRFHRHRSHRMGLQAGLASWCPGHSRRPVVHSQTWPPINSSLAGMCRMEMKQMQQTAGQPRVAGVSHNPGLAAFKGEAAFVAGMFLWSFLPRHTLDPRQSQSSLGLVIICDAPALSVHMGMAAQVGGYRCIMPSVCLWSANHSESVPYRIRQSAPAT